MSTTQILFNSPALHSLKRDQLVKLCKIHSLKGSGKKKELVERLKLHAKTLPPDNPLNIAIRSENPEGKPPADSEDEVSDHSREGDVSTPINDTRPSEQWEVVMETITEVDEETLRNNRGASDRQVGEFGTTTSKASVTSSLKAIATSLGLKRNTSKAIGTTSSSSSLSSREVTQSSSTLPTSDTNGGPEDPAAEPIPGQSDLQGLPAPSAARLSLSQAPATTTIRLVSNPATNAELLLSPPKLKPFETSFDLVPATPGGTGTSSAHVWPLSPGGATRESLYPPVPTFQGFGDLHKQQSPRSAQYDYSDMDLDVDMPGGLTVPSIREPTPEEATASARFNTGATPRSSEKPSAGPVDIFSPAPTLAASARSQLSIPRSEPFVFGSPLPQHNLSNLQFRTAAQSVLDEMNKRLAEEGIEAVDTDVLNVRQKPLKQSAAKKGTSGPPRVGDVFEKIHQKEFEKMDSIASHYAARRGVQGTAPQPILSKKRKSSLVVKERQPGVPTTRRRPNSSRVTSGASMKILPGGFAEDGDEDDEVANRRMSKRPRVELEESDVQAQPDKASRASSPDPKEEVQKQKEREAIRRRLEHNKAKRRSSMGRPSLGRAPPPKVKPARFGFLASAKSLVQNVWNRGAGSKAPSNVPVPKPVQLKVEIKTLPKSAGAKKSATSMVPGSSGAPPLSSQTKHVPSSGSNTSARLNTIGRPTLATPAISGGGGVTATPTSSHIWKSPNPLLNPPTSSSVTNPRSSTVAGYGQSNNRGTSLVGFSSLGRKTALPANDSCDSSMKAQPDTRTPAAGTQKHTSGIPRARTTSTLMAPTASSLAKTNSFARIPTSTHIESSTLTKATSSKQRHAISPQPSATLEQITNSPQSPAFSPLPAKIFSQPLSPPPARPPMSLTAAATSIVTKVKLSSMAKPPDLSKAKILPGRKPRISRSKVIARLASQRAGGASSGTEHSAGRVRSSMGADAAGKTRQSYGGPRGGDLLMSAKKRVRQSEHAQRRSRAVAGDRQRMDID